MNRWLRLGLGLAAMGTGLAAAEPAAETHQFDFWLGEWEVSNPAGAVAGHSRIDSIAEGGGLLENWTDSGGTTGKSLNVYNPIRKCWQQFWVGSGGSVLELSGGLVNGSMVLTGSRVGPKGAAVLDRISWTPRPDGSVRQHWEVSRDGGKNWSDNFDGTYRRPK